MCVFCVQKIEELKQYLPDLGWMKDFLPESDTLQQASEALRSLVSSVHEKLPEKVISLDHTVCFVPVTELVKGFVIAFTFSFQIYKCNQQHENCSVSNTRY